MQSRWIRAVAAVVAFVGGASAQTPAPPPPSEIVHENLCDVASEEGVPYRTWVSGDFLVWKVRSGTLPSLVSTIPVGVVRVATLDRFEAPDGNFLRNGNAADGFAVLRFQSAPGVGSGQSLNLGEHLGARLTAGVWLDADESLGLEGSGFYLNRRGTGFNSSTATALNQFPVTFPFVNSVFVVTPGVNGGPDVATLRRTLPTFVIRQSVAELSGRASTALWGAEANVRHTSADLRAVGGFLGVRYVNFSEDLNIRNAVRLYLPDGFDDRGGLGQPLDTNFPRDLTFATNDIVRTHNHFAGAQAGIDLDMYVWRFALNARAKAAVGVVHQSVDLLGSTTSSNQGTAAGGLLSAPGDQGRHERNRIAFVPEVNIKLGYRILPNWRAYVGYDFLYLSSVVRPGDQTSLATSRFQTTVAGTDTVVNVTQPALRFKAEDVWVNGLNFGMEWRY